jgi:hypothetical protein
MRVKALNRANIAADSVPGAGHAEDLKRRQRRASLVGSLSRSVLSYKRGKLERATSNAGTATGLGWRVASCGGGSVPRAQTVVAMASPG